MKVLQFPGMRIPVWGLLKQVPMNRASGALGARYTYSDCNLLIPGTRTCMNGVPGGLDFKIWDSLGIWGFHDLGVLGVRALGSSRGHLGSRTWGHRGVWDVYSGVWDPLSPRMGPPNFGVPQRGKSLLKK